jgi:hypothetical protein
VNEHIFCWRGDGLLDAVTLWNSEVEKINCREFEIA